MDEFTKIVPSAFRPFIGDHQGSLTCIKNAFKHSIALDLKTHSIPKSILRKILVEKNTTIIAHEINKLRIQILEALHIKTKKTP